MTSVIVFFYTHFKLSMTVELSRWRDELLGDYYQYNASFG